MDLQENLEKVRVRIRAACERAARDPSGVSLVAVTKTFGPQDVRDAADCGLTLMGESKVQEAAQKIPLCPGNLEWHLVGHLQSNKAKVAARLFRMIHSVDSLKLLETINAACAAAGVDMPVCLEVNVSGESSKFGLAPEAVPAVLESCGSLMNVSVVGLMTIPPFTEDPEGARPYFRKLRELRDGWRQKSGVGLDGLSMGMSHDFEVAIEEGATWIRLGSILFGERKKQKMEAVENG